MNALFENRIVYGLACERCEVIDDSVHLRDGVFVCADCVDGPCCRDCGVRLAYACEDGRCQACHVRHYGEFPSRGAV